MWPLTTDRLRIQPLAAGDVEAFATYRRDPHIARWQSWTPHYSIDDALELVASQPAGAVPPAGEWLQLAVRSLDGRTLFGDVALQTLDDQPDTYEVGVTFDRAHQSRGLAYEAMHCLVDYLFAQARAHRVVAFCDARNESATNLMHRLGFRQESHQVDADFFKGEWTTVDGFAMLQNEFGGPLT